MSLYCGNNLASSRRKRKRVGSRYECLKQGIGLGLSLPVDSDYSLEYVPIDERKFYCGKREELPDGYDVMGNSFLCHLKGIGIGKMKRAQSRKRKSSRKKSRKPKRRNSRKRKSSRKNSRKSRKRKSSRKNSRKTKRRKSRKRSKR